MLHASQGIPCESGKIEEDSARRVHKETSVTIFNIFIFFRVLDLIQSEANSLDAVLGF